MRKIGGLLVVAVLLAGVAEGARRTAPIPAGAGTMVNLPQTMVDATGNNWMIYQQGWLQMQGNNPVYGQGAMLTINGNQPGQRNNRARLDTKTGELIFDLAGQQGLTIQRRVLLDKKNSYVRYIDIFRNDQAQEQSVNVQFNTNLNYGVNSAQILSDQRKKDHNLAWIGQTDNGPVAVEIFAGRGAKATPQFTWQPGNNTVQTSFQQSIPAGKEIAILHIHAVAVGSEAGSNFAEGLKPAKVLADVPLSLRKEIINYSTGNGMVGDYEVLRGDLFDVVELRGGDQYRGTLQEPVYRLETFYGKVELPASRVVGLINVGDFRPRQLLVTSDGEIFGGKLEQQIIKLQLSSGQVTQIPLTQISRMGYRKRSGEPEEWTLSKPMVVLRSGDRMQIDVPQRPIEVETRYGKLSLAPQAVAALVLASEEHAVHEIDLADGSRFAGLVAGDFFDMMLAGGKQAVRFPASAVARIQFAPPAEADPDSAAVLELTNGDRLVGQLAGQLKLDTSFDTILVNGPEVKKLSHPEGSALDLQVTLWDDSTVSGQLQQPDVQVQLGSGVNMSVPVALIGDYVQPLPEPSATMVERIKQSVAALSADDFAKREQAQADLVSLGAPVARVLKELRGSQPPEAQQRIDAILKQVEKKSERPGAGATGSADPAMPAEGPVNVMQQRL